VLAAAVELQREGAPIGDAQRGLEALGQPLRHVGAHAQAVDDDVDVVLLGLLQLGQGVGLDHRAVDAEAHVARACMSWKSSANSPLRSRTTGASTSSRVSSGSASTASTIWLTLCACSGRRVVGAEGRAGARVEQAQVVVDLGDRADGGARVVAGGLLLDADGRRQALDDVDIGLVHQLQELPRVGDRLST
jgi:hypothetical protein